MNSDVPCELFWPLKSVNLGLNECAVSLTDLSACKETVFKRGKELVFLGILKLLSLMK